MRLQGGGPRRLESLGGRDQHCTRPLIVANRLNGGSGLTPSARVRDVATASSTKPNAGSGCCLGMGVGNARRTPRDVVEAPPAAPATWRGLEPESSCRAPRRV